MRRIPIRMKLALALALPLLALLVVTGVAVRATSGNDTWLVALALAAVGGALVLIWLVSRSITEPLRSLTEQAKDMAERRLPEAVLQILDTPLGEDVCPPEVAPVAVVARDEVGDVADALNSVQETALDLAVEQAVLRRNIADSFVNLGRRNQNLLGRQLDFITELESIETDPDLLASLFRLDHLATRMRRNAESLLVLAGIEPPRKWAAPVRLTDVIRAALGEVEDYQRVTLVDVESATVLGSCAADLAHLVAELVENALTFSPPDERVEISGRPADDGYRLTVVDHGLGMGEEDLHRANLRLVGGESFTIAPSKYLGHYVAGNLAARHGVGLRLANGPGIGVVASVHLPARVLTTEAPEGDPITDPHGTKAVLMGRADLPDVPAPPVRPAAPGAAVPPPEAAAPVADAPVAAAPVAAVAAAPVAPVSDESSADAPTGDDPTVPMPVVVGAGRLQGPLQGGPVPTPRVQQSRTASGLAKRDLPPEPTPARYDADDHDAVLARIARTMPQLSGGAPAVPADDNGRHGAD